MRKVYTTDNVTMAWHLRNVLEQHDIAAQVRNANLYSVAGELPVNECLPEIWVRPLDFRRAEQILRETQTDAENCGPDWQCASCSQMNAGSFELCWNCQANRPESGG